MNLPFNALNKVYIDQVVRGSSSFAAKYYPACRGKSKADFINKLKTVKQELDEAMFFYEMIAGYNEPFKNELRELYKEANQLLSMASINTANSNLLKEISQKNPKPEI